MTVQGQLPVTYGYDDTNRLTSVTQGTSLVAITYDNADRRSTLTLPNGIVTTYGYDNANQPNASPMNLSATVFNRFGLKTRRRSFPEPTSSFLVASKPTPCATATSLQDNRSIPADPWPGL